MQGVTIIGPGRMGGALAVALSHAGYNVERLVGRDKNNLNRVAQLISPRPRTEIIGSTHSINSEIIFITSPDPVISEIAAWLAGIAESNSAVFHVSGALSSNELRPLSVLGFPTGSIHPLVSVITPASGAEKFVGSYFCLEGDPAAKRLAKRIVRNLGGQAFAVETQFKPLYHLAAVMSAGHLIALADISFSLMERAGIERRMVHRILLPLIKSTVANLEATGTNAALTGPFSRGDISTVTSHIDILKNLGLKTESDVYLDLALRSIQIVMRNKHNPELMKLEELILLAKRNGRC